MEKAGYEGVNQELGEWFGREVCERRRKGEILLESRSDVSEWERGGRGTSGMNGFLAVESKSLIKSDSSERGHVCL